MLIGGLNQTPIFTIGYKFHWYLYNLSPKIIQHLNLGILKFGSYTKFLFIGQVDKEI